MTLCRHLWAQLCSCLYLRLTQAVLGAGGLDFNQQGCNNDQHTQGLEK